MDLSLERDGSALGSLFQQIIADMKNTSPLWDDFLAKAGKLHACLRAAIQAIAAYLDAFQKIADAATNSRGASKEIGTALTRVCLRHKAVETRLKTFTSAIMDYLVLPLQDKLEDWKRQVATIDKEHAKEYKRCRAELKKRSTDTLRLQKKARKGQNDAIQSLVDSHMHDVTMRRAELEEVEKKSLRSAMIEERMRYCTFVDMLQPVVKEECEVMSELGHLQEAMQSIANVTKDPNVLPQSSEELILDAKSTVNLYPESPGGGSGSQGCSNSLGSRKSSVCSISSMNSSGSSGSPGHHHYPRSLSQLISPTIRLKPGESSDSGFCSSPALTSQVSTATSQSHAVSTWPPHSQDAPSTDRPHTISSAYEKGHQRPALTVYTFQNPETIMEAAATPTPTSQKSPGNVLCRPPLPVRCSSLERPLSTNNSARNGTTLLQRQCPSPIPAHVTKEISHLSQQQLQQQQQQSHQLQNSQHLQQQPQPQPTYVNMSELATMAAMKLNNQHQQQNQISVVLQQQQPNQPPPQQQSNHSHNLTQSVLQQQQSTDSHSSVSSESSLINHPNHSSSNTPSLHSHPSIESHQTNIGHTYTPSSGASTPQNHFSPLLTNSPATPLPAGAPLVVGYINPASNNNSTCSSTSLHLKDDARDGEDVLKITETDSTTNNSATSNNVTNAINSIDQQENCNSGTTAIATSVATDANEADSTECDERVRASVLQKASMFEKQAAAVNSSPVLPLTGGRSNHSISSGESIYSTRRDEAPVKGANDVVAVNEKDNNKVDKFFEDSIQELNDLIGELDSFQREHEAREKSHCSSTDSASKDNQSTATPTPSLKDENAPNVVNPQQLTTGGVTNNINGSVTDVDSDKISIGSFNFSTQSTTASDTVKFAYSDSELSRFVSETSSMGYENPTFALLAQSEANCDELSMTGDDSISNAKRSINDNDSGSGVVVIYDHTIPCTPDIDYVKQNSEIVVLRTKDPQIIETPSSSSVTANLTAISTENPKQRLSSFRSEHYATPDTNNRNTLSNNNQGCGTRIARHSSVNNVKPPPPVRRSSSVTPSHNLSTPNSPNLIQQNTLNNSVENLPPPPAYFLDRQHSNSIPQSLSTASTIKVAETVKALSAIRHTPASPSAIRRAQNTINQQQQQQTATIQSQNQENNIYSTTPLIHDAPAVALENVYNKSPPPQPPPKTQIYQHYQHPPSIKSPTSLPQHQQHSQQQQHDNRQNHHNHHGGHYSNYHQQQEQQLPPPPPPYEHSIGPPPLPPPNPQPKHQYNTTNTNNHSGSDANSSFRTTCNSPGIYAQPKQVSSLSSFRSSSPSPIPQQQTHTTVAQPKTNPILIAQLNARLNKQQPQQHEYGTYQKTGNHQDNNRSAISAQHHQPLYGSTPNSPHHHQQQQHHHHHQQQHNQSYNQPSIEQLYSRQVNDVYCQGQQHLHHHQQQHYDAAQPLPFTHSTTNQTAAAASAAHQNYHQYQQIHYSGPPPQEEPPPPPVASATMPRSMRAAHSTGASTISSNHAVVSAPCSTLSSTSTIPKNHHLRSQQHHHHQGVTSNNNNSSHSQRTPSSATAGGGHLHHKQPPVPSRHSSVQQKIFVTTNPFMSTTAIHCASGNPPASASPTAAYSQIYGTGGNVSRQTTFGHNQPQQHYQQAVNTSSGGQYITNTNYSSTNNDKMSSIRSKTKAEFLENLNAKLAKQGISGRAFAVRNLINSKALLYQNPRKLSRPSSQYQQPQQQRRSSNGGEPDPRLCHESLMDQIKRGANLKRNQKINDRSAPKIH